MTRTIELSAMLDSARKQIKQAHRRPETCSEDMVYTADAIQNLGIQHYAQGGEDTPDRIIEAQVRAMADLVFTYSEQAYEAQGGELTFFDSRERERFEERVDDAHETAMTALQEVEDDS